jgi:FKBP-type peptidyl-prolyl cis-trans isomerase 2
MKIIKGNKVTLEYEGKLDNGDIFDSSKGREPLEFIAGHKQVIAGFDEAVIGMKKGEEKEFHIEAKKAYGEPRPELMKEIPKTAIQADREMEAGMIIGMTTPDGHQIPLIIKEVKKDTVLLDMNHPLAGKNLNFKIKILDISEASEEHECNCREEGDCGEDCECDEDHECECEDCDNH